mmetsp:Transcript_9690/g.13572  ORF Transcript_9690/g.13572 Transcript_9690/m.13572 type:complete len:205 (-) Transcript_9690:301-915(-)|eukprot:CAMPEP_0185727444 /NCGR_PEP_ID=MMETSP1171-20130828/3134_1 /TAXON_ID=374046 /ORGANISM="Helicotheca tamensis, Strain CCMP826" /LENGTH=204 /DNA_ID=CAMNT_0028396019 /DNA_START=27 /DNA_END=641 /DNA_ORIENTATION=-
MSPRLSFLILALAGLSSAFVPAPFRTVSKTKVVVSKCGTACFSTADDVEPVVTSEISRRAALITSAVLAAGGTVVADPSAAGAYTPPLFKQVEAIENANYMGQLTQKVYEPNSNGAPEKHLPQVKVDGQNVEISAPHVMTEEHYIQFMWLKDAKTNEVVLVKALPPTDPSPPTFKAKVPEGVELRPYLFCNLHGLWKGEDFKVA